MSGARATGPDFRADVGVGRVSLVGAGPGSADLITVRGARRLAEADLVLYDALASEEMRVYAPGARWFFVGKRACRASIDQEVLNRLLVKYARRGWRVFPCQWRGARRKQPLTKRGFYDASSDPAQIREWWERSPHALIGSPTGRLTGFVVLDMDSKRAGATGFDTLAELGFAMLPETPMAHTASGGLHLYFEPPDRIEIRNTAGAYGAGIGKPRRS